MKTPADDIYILDNIRKNVVKIIEQENLISYI